MPLRPHARTLATVRLLHAIGPIKRRGGRIPRQQQPDAIRLEYFNAIMPHIRQQLSYARGDRTEILHLLIEQHAEQSQSAKFDIDRKQRALNLVERSGRAAANAFRPRELEQVATQFGKRTSEFNRQQLDRQVRAAMSVPLEAVEKPIRDKIPQFAAENVSLIKTVPERFHARLAADVQEAFETGMHPDTLAERFVELDDISESDARRIARDQIGKLNGQFNEDRQQAMGVTGYTWRTMRDERVRTTPPNQYDHAEREGQHFEWDSPPEDGHPGEPICCRCYSEPDFSDITNDL